MSSKLKIWDTGIPVTDVLELISQGFTYERILFILKSLTYEDIFHAVKVAKEIAEVHLAFKFSSLEENISAISLSCKSPPTISKGI